MHSVCVCVRACVCRCMCVCVCVCVRQKVLYLNIILPGVSTNRLRQSMPVEVVSAKRKALEVLVPPALITLTFPISSISTLLKFLRGCQSL